MKHTAKSYAAHWSTLTGHPESDIYTPHALNPPSVIKVADRVQWLGDLVCGTVSEVIGDLVYVSWDDHGKSTEDLDAEGLNWKRV